MALPKGVTEKWYGVLSSLSRHYPLASNKPTDGVDEMLYLTPNSFSNLAMLTGAQPSK